MILREKDFGGANFYRKTLKRRVSCFFKELKLFDHEFLILAANERACYYYYYYYYYYSICFVLFLQLVAFLQFVAFSNFSGW